MNQSDDFDCEVDDTVVVRIRENGDTGEIEAKFVGTVVEFRDRHELLSDQVVVEPPWAGRTMGLTLGASDAEFEVVSDASEVYF